ncbi:MAG TPA: FtsL-like putative cell division protein [Flavobacteriaceae bacterium]|nr:FtsL-like putative cell division protein [Flavobacteriaceae bacterium]
MKKGVYDFLRGKFLFSDDAMKHWRFILFCTVLAIVMIYSSHSAERKVHEIARLSEGVKELRSEFVDARTRLMRMKMESTIIDKMAKREIAPATEPPFKIIVIGDR